MEENKGKSSAEALPTRLLNCASFWPTFEAVFDLEALRRDHPSPNDYDDQVLWVQEKDENKRDYFSETSGSQLLKGNPMTVFRVLYAEKGGNAGFVVVEGQLRCDESLVRDQKSSSEFFGGSEPQKAASILGNLQGSSFRIGH